MKKIIFKAAFNSLSFGNVSYNFAREFYRKDMQVSIFPIGNSFDFSAFDKLDPDFKSWLEDSTNSRFNTLHKDTPSLSLWHINESHEWPGSKNLLYTFYELDSPTMTEKNIVDFHQETVFSSSHAKKCFELVNCQNVHYVPIGFDEDFVPEDSNYFPDRIHFGLMGKWEKRKHTEKIIKLWAKKYGNNPKYQLSCCVINPFFKNEEMNSIIGTALENKMYANINFLPRLKTNTEVNQFMNSIDIDLTGLSGAEGWNLPAFNSTCLGKWSIVLNSTSHKDWANKDNSLMVEPNGKTSAIDGVFFTENSPYNQGSINTFDDEEVISKFELAESYKGKKNTEGEKLKEKFTYKNTVESLLEILN